MQILKEVNILITLPINIHRRPTRVKIKKQRKFVKLTTMTTNFFRDLFVQELKTNQIYGLAPITILKNIFLHA